jgi:hypothetical protein
MIIYDFIEQRFDQLNEDNYLEAEYMVDSLLNNNTREFKRINSPNNDIEEICLGLWRELDQTYDPNEDIPF